MSKPAEERRAQSSPRDSLSSIDGKVVNGSALPIADATIFCFPADRNEPMEEGADPSSAPDLFVTKSAADGSFTLQFNRGTAFYTVFARAPGYSPAGIERVGPGATCELLLHPERILRGRVADFQSRPVESARVESAAIIYNFMIRRVAVTDAAGNYTISGLLNTTGLAERAVQHRYYKVTAPGFAAHRSEGYPLPGGEPNHYILDFYLSRGATLTFRALDGETEQPIPNAKILFWSTEMQRTIGRMGAPAIYNPEGSPILGEGATDAAGIFICKNVPTWGYQWHMAASSDLNKSALGTATAEVDGKYSGGIAVFVPDENEQKQYDIYCSPVAIVKGRVVDGRGEGAARVALSAHVPSKLKRYHIFGKPGSMNNPEGFQFTDKNGYYSLQIPASRAEPVEAKIYCSEYGVEPIAATGQCDARIRAGEITTVPDIILQKPKDVASVAVNVYDPEGNPAWGAMVGEYSNDFGNALIADRNGRVVKAFPYNPAGAPLRRRLFVKYEGCARAATELFVVSVDNPPELKVMLAPGKSVRGKVAFASGAVPMGGMVEICRGEMRAEQLLKFRPEPGAPAPFLSVGHEKIRGDGTFEFKELPDGPFILIARGCYTKEEAQQADAYVENVADGSENVQLVITNVRTLVSTPRPPDPFVSVTVQVADESGRAPERGYLEIENLDRGGVISSSSATVPGIYPLTLGFGRWRIGGLFPGYVTNPKEVEIPEGAGPLKLTLTIKRGAVLSGRAYLRSGELLRSGRIYIYKGEKFFEGEIGPSGDFSIEGLSPGMFDSVVVSGSLTFDGNARILACGNITLEITNRAERLRQDFTVGPAGDAQFYLSSLSLPAEWKNSTLLIVNEAGEEVARIQNFASTRITRVLQFGKYTARVELGSGGTIVKPFELLEEKRWVEVSLDR